MTPVITRSECVPAGDPAGRRWLWIELPDESPESVDTPIPNDLRADYDRALAVGHVEYHWPTRSLGFGYPLE